MTPCPKCGRPVEAVPGEPVDFCTGCGCPVTSEAVREAFDYARRTGIRRVQVNNPHVLEDLETGILESGDLEIVTPGGARRG